MTDQKQEHQLAAALFYSLSSCVAFSWTDKVAAFSDPKDAEIFKQSYPDWSLK